MGYRVMFMYDNCNFENSLVSAVYEYEFETDEQEYQYAENLLEEKGSQRGCFRVYERSGNTIDPIREFKAFL